MNLVYTTRFDGEVALPDPEESLHLMQVLRKRSGDRMLVTDGSGRGWLAELLPGTRQEARLRILGPADPPQDPGYRLHIAIAPPKNTTRLEWFLEKVTEIGVHQITLIRTERSERSRWRHDRLHRILVSAMKQSGQFRLPGLPEAEMAFPDLVQMEVKHGEQRFLPTCDWGNLPDLSSVYTSGPEVLVTIGPEGDFSPAEVGLAREHGFIPVLLGRNRLRTETAGMVACSQIQLLHALSSSAAG